MAAIAVIDGQMLNNLDSKWRGADSSPCPVILLWSWERDFQLFTPWHHFKKQTVVKCGLYSYRQWYLSLCAVVKMLWTHKCNYVSQQQILIIVMINVLVAKTTDHAKPLSICFLSQYLHQIKCVWLLLDMLTWAVLSVLSCWRWQIGQSDWNIIANCGKSQYSPYISCHTHRKILF